MALIGPDQVIVMNGGRAKLSKFRDPAELKCPPYIAFQQSAGRHAADLVLAYGWGNVIHLMGINVHQAENDMVALPLRDIATGLTVAVHFLGSALCALQAGVCWGACFEHVILFLLRSTQTSCLPHHGETVALL